MSGSVPTTITTTELYALIERLNVELGSMGALIEDLDRRGICTKAVVRLDGRVRGGIRFGVGPLAHLLKNRFYIGEVVYRGEVHAGEREPILDRDLFEAVQAKLAANAVDARSCMAPIVSSGALRSDDVVLGAVGRLICINAVLLSARYWLQLQEGHL